MPILNYTTKIEARKTAGEISELLADLGVNAVRVEYDDNKQPLSVSFQVNIQDRKIDFRLPSRWEGIYRLLLKENDIPKALRTEAQARRVSWRIVKDWIEAQMAIIQSETAELAEVFLPYAVNPKTGMTLYNEFAESHLLGSGSAVEGDYREEGARND